MGEGGGEGKSVSEEGIEDGKELFCFPVGHAGCGRKKKAHASHSLSTHHLTLLSPSLAQSISPSLPLPLRMQTTITVGAQTSCASL